MGRAHAQAFRAVAGVFDLPAEPVMELLADVDEATAHRAAVSLGFNRSCGDWRALVEDREIDLVDIAAPNVFHREMALAAIAAAKPVYCEKPLAPTANEAGEMVAAAAAAGIRTMVGFNYLKNPITALAREIVESGEIGEVFAFRGTHFEDYMTDPEGPYTWRFDPAGGDGVTADLASHVIATARYLIGDLEAVCADGDTVVRERPVAPGAEERRAISVADQVRALVRFANGVAGTVEASWVATGRKMQHAFEVTGTKGAIRADFERLNELELYRTDAPAGREGFVRILTGPAHRGYASFTPAPGHQLGFNDLKTIEVRDLIRGLVGEPAPWPDFHEAWQVQRVVDAIARSRVERGWVAIGE